MREVSKVNLIVLISYLIILLGSLRGFNFSDLGGIRLFILLSFGILVLISPFYKIDIRYLKEIIFFYFFVFLNVLISFFFNDIKIHFFSYFGFIIAPIYGLLLFSFFKKRKEILIKILKSVLKFHLFFFYVQLFSFYLFGIQIDYLEFVTNEPQRIIGGVYSSDTMIRPCGLSNEPASYAIFVVSMIFCLLTANKKITKLIIAASVSVILSFSASGVMFLSVIYMIMYWDRIFSIKNCIIFTISAIVVFFLFYKYGYYFFNESVIDYFIYKIQNFQESTSYKVRFGNVFSEFSNLTSVQKYFGTGFGNIIIENNLGSFLSQFIIQSGILFFVSLSIVFFRIFKSFNVKIKSILIMILLSLSTHFINHIVTWYFLSIILIIEYNKYNENNTYNIRIR